MGSCFYNVGWQGDADRVAGATPPAGDLRARRAERGLERGAPARASSRLEQEAKLAGADAVLGVRITRGALRLGPGLIEFAAVGTAVVSEGFDFGDDSSSRRSRASSSRASCASGWMPIGITAGSTVTLRDGRLPRRCRRCPVSARAWQNQELTELTQGVYAARQLAMRHVERQARELEAAGIVGMQIEQHQHPREIDQQGYKRLDLIVTMHVIGTAVVADRRARRAAPTYIALR